MGFYSSKKVEQKINKNNTTMRKFNRKVTFSFLALVVVSSYVLPGFISPALAADFNEGSQPYSTLRVSNYTANPGCSTCWDNNSVSADVDDVVSLGVFVNNTSSETANSTKVSIESDVASDGESVDFTVEIWASNADPISDTVTVNVSGGNVDSVDHVSTSVRDNFGDTKSFSGSEDSVMTSSGIGLGNILPGRDNSRIVVVRIEIVGDGVDDQLMIASPVGVQEGLGIMGFCYAPYHYVYDFSFPVLVQIYNNEEVFQFPVVAVIDKNVPRKAQFFEIDEGEVSEDICEFKTEDIEVNLYDTNLNKVDGEISYQCFNQRCRLGETKGGKFVGKAPACYNGQLLIKGNDFSEKKEFFSTNKDRYIDVILDKEREVEIELKVGGKPLGSKTAIVSFAGKNGGRTVSTALPEVSRVKLSEGSYDLTVYVYGDSSIIISSSTKTQCTEVPRAGILGFFGSTKEKCFDITVPETKVEYALRGGGKSNIYLLDNQLQNGKLTLEVDEMPLPKNIGELQFNYASFETKGVLIR